MPANLQPVVIPSILPVGPWRAALGEQFFALHLSAGVFNEAPDGTARPLPATEKMPWEWGADADEKFIVIAARTDDAGNSTYDVFGVRLFTQMAEPHFDGQDTVTLDTVKRDWIDGEADASWNPRFVGADKRAQATLPEQLAFMSTFPGDLPQQLGLVKYFRLKPLGVDGKSGKNGLIASLDEITSFVAAPIVDGDAPVENFRFNDLTAGSPNWLDGWPYTGVARSAFVKPLTVKRGGAHLDFSDDGKVPARLKFDTYWPETDGVRPWSDGLERRFAEIFNAFVRLSEFEPPPVPGAVPGSPEAEAAKAFAEALENLRLKALAFNCQWSRPTDPAAGGSPNDSDRLIGALAVQLGAGLEPQIRDGLVRLHARLTSADSTRNRNLWIEILARNLNLAPQAAPREIFAKLHETRELLHQLLFFQWSLLFRLPEVSGGDFLVESVRGAWEALPEEETEESAGRSKKKVRALLEEYALRAQREKTDTALKEVFDSEPEPDALPGALADAAEAKLLSLCAAVGASSPPSFETDLTVCGSQPWVSYVDAYVSRLREALATTLGETERESKPGALTIKFDELKYEPPPDGAVTPSPEAGALDVVDPDVWRYIAGIVPMLREPGKPWRILSAANIHHQQSEHDGTDAGLFDKPAVVPFRVPFRGGVRHPFVTYDQRSVIAESALTVAALGGGRFEVTRELDPLLPAPPPDSRYAYRAVLQDAFKMLKLARLRFGRKYEMAAFIMDTAGGVPDELATRAPELDDNGQPLLDENGDPVIVPIPWRLDYAKWEGEAPQQDFTVPRVVAFDYLRRVPVGQVRVTPLREGLSNWPEPPTGVFPLAKEIKDAGGETAQAAPPPGEERRVQAVPLALLYGEGGQPTTRINLNLRPPTVDTDVLERWLDPSALVAPAPDKRPHLEQVLTEYFKRLARRNDPAVGQSKPSEDLSLDDPAVGALLVTLEEYDFDTSRWSLKGKQKIVPPQTGEGIARHQWPGVNILCERGAQGVTDSSFVEAPEVGGYRITVPSDHATVARVSVYALVDKRLTREGAETRRFPSKFFRPEEEGKPEKDEDVGEELAATYSELQPVADEFHCLRPFRVLLETPTDEMPLPSELWRELRVARIVDRDRWNQAQKTKTQDREAVAVCLVGVPETLTQDPDFHKPEPPADRHHAFRNVITCDVLKQTWRWQGRPVKNTVPWLSDGKTEKDGEVLREVLEWEVGAFAEMDDLFDTQSFPVNYTHGSAEPLFVDGYDKDPRAYYVRYGVRGHSRYKPLFPRLATPVTSRQEVRLPGDGGGAGAVVLVSGVGWRRVLVPYRGPKPPRPVVKAVVPLAQAGSVEKGQGTASPLMIVLDETMFSFCGITEAVECEVELATLPKDLSAEQYRLFQVGPDPLLGTGTYVEELKNVKRLLLRCEDPFGHTFDTDARQPLFSSTSLVLRPEFGKPADGFYSLASWDLARIRFRRLSSPAVGGDDAGTDDEWTKPTWVQFTPAASFGLRWDKEAPLEKLAAAAEKVSVKLEVIGKEDDYLFAQEKKFFKYWLFLTKAVRDFRGFREREHYVGTAPVDVRKADGYAVLEFQLPEQVTGGALRCRLLEAQVPPNETPSDNLWADLFDLSSESDDAKARITRISPALVIAPGGA